MRVLIYGNVVKPQNKPYIQELLRVLEHNNVSYILYKEYREQLDPLGIVLSAEKIIDEATNLANENLDYVITLGGDGTILRAITQIRDSNIPILGINLGRLGFLSNIEKSLISVSIEELLQGDFICEKRALLQLESNMPIFGETPYALNDFTLHKRDTSSMITIHAYVDGTFLNSYWADGLIISTPTGSTGYNLSCGGPIIFPGSGNFVITPVAPHNLNVRPIVLSDNSEVILQVEGRSENFLCTLDSRYETITAEHELRLSRARHTVNFVHPKSVNFMKTIRHKLMWGLDKRN